MQDEHRVGDGDVLEVLVTGLERLEHGLDRLDVAERILGCDHRERIPDVGREVLTRAQAVREYPSLGPALEGEQRQAGGVAPDRGGGFGGALLQRPGGLALGTLPIAREEARLQRPDRPPPAARRCVGPALAVTRRGPVEPSGGLLGATLHQQGQAGASGGVAHPGQLALPRIGVLSARQARLAVAVASLLPPRMCAPVLHAATILTRGMARELREVIYVDGVRTAFGKAGPGGAFWRTRADDMGVKVVRELLRRNPEVPLDRIGDVIVAATAQVGDQGLTLGRDVALLAGIPHSVPGFAVDRMCAGALTAVTAGAGEIAMGAADVILAGGVEHMGHHPMGENVDFNPRFVAERLVDTSAVTMGATAENLHDLYPGITKEDADAFAVRSQSRAATAWENGVMRETVVPMSVFTDDGWRVADRDEFLRPDTTLEGLAGLRTPFRPGGRVTAGNSAGLTDGATACFLAAEETVAELGLEPRMRLVGFAFSGVEPEVMGIGPIPATQKVLARTGLSLDDIGLFELNEPFAVQVLTWCEGMGVDPQDERLNPYGGAIACGHPLAATGVRLMAQLAYGFRERPEVRYGLTALCVGMGMGAALVWENVGSDPVKAA